VDRIYQKLGKTEAFQELCRKIEQDKNEYLKELRINQLCLKAVKCPETFKVLEFKDNFNWVGMEVSSPWTWSDIDGTSSYAINHHSASIEISVSEGNNPMLLQALSGNFVLETHISGERLGGISISKDENRITFERWQPYHYPFIVLTNKRNQEYDVAGRGFLESESLILRLERGGTLFQAYCSADGINWYSCGWTECEMEDPIQVGIFASPLHGKRVVTSFNYFKVYREVEHGK
jgi:hypothetical protein